MSILPLPLVPGMLLHSLTFPAYNTTGEHVNGRWVRTRQPDYIIQGSIVHAGEKDLKVLPEGEASEGAVVIRSTIELFMEDSKQTATEVRQTYVLWENETWRVRKLASSAPHGGVYKYIALKTLERTDSGPKIY